MIFSFCDFWGKKSLTHFCCFPLKQQCKQQAGAEQPSGISNADEELVE